MNEQLPKFLIIGAAKAGTTTLFDLLKQHPQVFLPFAKEPMFFSHDENYQRGLDWYKNTYFKGSERYLTSGEATPHYLYWSEKTAARIKKAYNGNSIKIIVVLRDPVARAYSWYGNMRKDGTEDLSFENALAEEGTRIKEEYAELYRTGSMQYGYYRGGCYARLLVPFLELFPRNDFKFILQDDIINEYAKTSCDILDFIGLEPDFPITPIRSNPASMPYSNGLHRWLRQRSEFKEQIKKFIPFKLRYRIKAWAMNANLKPTHFPQMDKNTGEELRRRFESDILALQKIIERDLSTWLLS
jgi:hypothetical protein